MADDSYFSLKFVGWTSFIEYIVRTVAVGAVTSGSMAVKASMARVGTVWASRWRAAVFFWVSEAPAILALAGRRSVRLDSEKFAS